MIYYPVEQNTPEWLKLRLGIPTASEFHKIVTPKTVKLSSQSDMLMYRLLAEWITGAPVENYESQWMQRGHDEEDRAVKGYEMLTGFDTTPGGFITSDDAMMGCSPDRLVGDTGDLEIKCGLIHTQVRYALTGEIEEDYKPQLQGRLLIHEREWVDIFPFHPLLAVPAVRVTRDEAYIANLESALREFVDRMLAARAELEKRFGPFQRFEEIVEPESGFIGADDVEELIAAYRKEGRL